MVTKKSAAAVTVAKTAEAPANIAPADSFEASGAPHQVTDIDAGHPAVDADPRANTTAEQNRIDWNDPVRPAGDVVAEQLGMKPGPDAD